MCPDKDKCWRQKVIQLKKLQDTTTNFNKILKNNSKCVFFQADGVCCGNVVVKLSIFFLYLCEDGHGQRWVESLLQNLIITNVHDINIVYCK